MNLVLVFWVGYEPPCDKVEPSGNVNWVFQFWNFAWFLGRALVL